MRTLAGLYIHIPVCNQKCYYCDFYSLPLHQIETPGFWDDYLEKCLTQLRQNKSFSNYTLGSIYFGGGTPSLAPIDLLGKIIAEGKKLFRGVYKNLEVSIEANPDSLGDGARLEKLARIGVNRITLGVQSTHPKTLAYLGREASLETTQAALFTLSQGPIKNYGIDLIYGVPGQKVEQLQSDIQLAVNYGAKHISAYGLTLEPNTPLHRQVNAHTKNRPSDRRFLSHFAYLRHTLPQHGFTQYEISNFAGPGYRSLHNMIYWTHRPYLGAGPAAHSYDTNTRWATPKNLAQYLTAPQNPARPQKTAAQHFPEIMIGAARITAPQSYARFRKTLTPAQYAQFTQNLKSAAQEGYIQIKNGAFQLTEKGQIYSDALLLTLTQNGLEKI